MCGIMGYVGKRPCVNIIFEGLKALEYRGYDSSGIAVLSETRYVVLTKAKGKLKELEPSLVYLPKTATVGIGHTRWATHGEPNTKNAHPHATESLAIVHNGIIENYKSLRAGLEAGGIKLETETDTEVVLYLIREEQRLYKDMYKAILSLTQKLKGAFSLGILSADEPEVLYLVKQGSPLVIGFGEQENYFASDAAAIVKHTKKAIFLEDGEIARVGARSCEIWNFRGEKINRAQFVLEWNAESIEKKGYAHYMLKEIFEQPAVITRTIERFMDTTKGEIKLKELMSPNIPWERFNNMHSIACGSAYLSAMIGRYAFERVSQLPVNVELASEFRYRQPVIAENSLFFAVSQSGETMDTLESAKFAKQHKATIFSLCNVLQSSIPRESEACLYMESGPEIGVASTKAFTSMVVCQYLLALGVAQKRGRDVRKEVAKAAQVLKILPSLLDKVLGLHMNVKKLAEKYFEASNFLYIGRGEHYPVALEGALKLKEISYIHAEAFAAGELKHGPIALVDRNMPVMVIAPQDQYYDKVISNIEQVRARLGRIIAVGGENDKNLMRLCDDYIAIPQVEVAALQTIISVVPLQLFAYYVALLRGSDVDQPRNLAKSVTVE